MAKIITAYASVDGKEFSTALEADAHDLALSQKVSVDAYAAEAKLGPAETTRARKYISGYTSFMTTFVPAEAANESGKVHQHQAAA